MIVLPQCSVDSAVQEPQLIRAMKGHFSPERHFGFEAAAWYWHFVDVVWLFLFICIYWWGAGEIAHH